MTPDEIRLRSEIASLKRQLVELTKKNIALKVERDKWQKKFEELSVTKLKTIRIKINGEEKA